MRRCDPVPDEDEDAGGSNGRLKGDDVFAPKFLREWFLSNRFERGRIFGKNNYGKRLSIFSDVISSDPISIDPISIEP